MKLEDLPKKEQGVARKIIKILEPFTPEQRKELIARAHERLGMRLSMMRADNGDWSLHPPVGAIKKGPVPTLASGPARKDEQGAWDRPTAADFDHAMRMYQEHLARQGHAQEQD